MSKFNKTYRDFVKDVLSEAVYTPSNQIGIPTTGNPKWTWVWTVKMFIYHNTRQYKNFFQTWAQEFQATWNGTIDKLKSSAGKPVNLAIAKDDRTIYIYPNAIFDKVEDTTLHFHLDPKKYREYKGFGYQVQTTNLQYWYNKNHNQESKVFNALQEDYGVDIAIKNGIKMEKVDFYWYKVYGKEKGQLSDFYVRAKNVMILEDLTAAWDKLIALYEQAKKEKKEAEQKQQAIDDEINNRAEAIYSDASKKKEVKELYHTIFKKKTGEIESALESLDIQQLKDIQAMAFYRYYNHYDLYATEHKTAEMADDYRHFTSQKEHLQGIREKDHRILYDVENILKQKGE